jgi:hypothetical protein
MSGSKGMKRYIDLIRQTFDFPTDEFSVKQGQLHIHQVPLMDIIAILTGHLCGCLICPKFQSMFS